MASKINTRKPFSETGEGYCVKCHQMRHVSAPANVTTRNGRPAVRGVCESCTAVIFVIGASVPD